MANIQEHGPADIVDNKCQREKDRERNIEERIYLKRKLLTLCELLFLGKMYLVTSLYCDQRVSKKDCARYIWS